jgi:hypothetical protein
MRIQIYIVALQPEQSSLYCIFSQCDVPFLSRGSFHRQNRHQNQLICFYSIKVAKVCSTIVATDFCIDEDYDI